MSRFFHRTHNVYYLESVTVPYVNNTPLLYQLLRRLFQNKIRLQYTQEIKKLDYKGNTFPLFLSRVLLSL